MELKNCPQCGKVFDFITNEICPECQKKDDECFRTIRNYIALHPGVSAVEVSKKTGISEEKIFAYIRQGRLSTADAAKKEKMVCERCGKFISRGRYCAPCQERLTSGLKKSFLEQNKKARENKGTNNSEKR